MIFFDYSATKTNMIFFDYSATKKVFFQMGGLRFFDIIAVFVCQKVANLNLSLIYLRQIIIVSDKIFSKEPVHTDANRGYKYFLKYFRNMLLQPGN